MPNLQPKIDELIIKFINGTLNSQERIDLQEWINSSDTNKMTFKNLTDKEWVATELEKIHAFDENAGWQTIATSLDTSHSNRFTKQHWYRWVAAAIIILTVGSSYWAYRRNNCIEQFDKNLSQEERFGKDIKAPESNKAVLTLADGRKIVLEDSANGQLVTQGDVDVTKTKDGQIIYKGNNTNTTAVPNENTLVVPKGSKSLRLVLNDGTQVWLNSGSSLSFPSKFVGKDRKVRMTGEVFFEVAKNPAMPFKVMANEIETQALGTQFNIDAYSDETVSKITLIEGSIKVQGKKSNGIANNLIVKPGQQVLGTAQLKLVENANVEEVMAWKNEEFYFDGASIKTIMNQISKYYDVDVVYKGNINYSFVMKISRTVPISELLKIMELTDLVRFKIEDNKITVIEYNKK